MFFIVVVFGILGYCFTEKYKEIEKLGLVIMSFGFVAFSIYNLKAMVKDVIVHNHLLKVLKTESKNELLYEALGTYEEKKLWIILFFHIFFSLLTVLVILRKYLIKKA